MGIAPPVVRTQVAPGFHGGSRASGGIRAVLMVINEQFLSLLIKLPTHCFADVAVELMKRESIN